MVLGVLGLLIWVMIIPMLVKVDFGALHEVRQHVRGIGVTLWEAIRGFQFQQTCALMVLIIVTVSLLDFLSQRLRKHFI